MVFRWGHYGLRIFDLRVNIAMVRMVKGESAKSEVAKSKDLYGYRYFVFALSPSPFNVFGSLYRLNITLAIKIVRFILSWLL